MFDHDQNRVHEACGISSERADEITSQMAENVKALNATTGISRLLELIHINQSFTDVEKLFLAFITGVQQNHD